MENASKALLIAAGVLVGLILISMITVSYRQISSYYNEKEKGKITEKLIEFNHEYTSYNKDNVRGSNF